ncbi:exopolysaccharide biosynthesis polyprenyl glycosylphosphotransferase [Actinorhabdospora filicis]|uniref:Exopolysaccharide biosynthesis polyprenyl glycosylphosphotransferase n=1 Tax=Actinorhabdospora filicis TaxID=1785913 RepID=A0A9W6SG85_9ACTN|nr:sugar transferase [Actinorhabdospora filicis]GLZ76589.1 exopolysaccharide biosynthesis polyprenyl glycosylphosphotransferase [Actinorhabdospora filicis]
MLATDVPVVEDISRGTVAVPRHLPRFARPQWQAVYLRKLLVFDLLVALAATVTAFVTRFRVVNEASEAYVPLFVVLPVAWLVFLSLNHAYESRYLYVGTSEYQRVLRAGIALMAVVALVSYALNVPTSRAFVLTAVPCTVALTLAGRFVLRRRLHGARTKGRCMRRVVLVGHPSAVSDLARQLQRERFHGLEVVGVCSPDGRETGALLDMDVQVLGSFEDAADAVAIAMADTVIVLSCPELDGVALRRMAWQLERGDIDLIVASAMVDVGGSRTSVRPVDGLPMLHLEHAALSGTKRLVKEAFDRVGALLLLAMLSPLLLVLVIWVRRSGEGPAMFAQERIGRDAKPFTILKFRTMYPDAEQRLEALRAQNDYDSVLFKMRDDPRVTPVGKVLRRFSLDELPQLWNVVRGDMSLVGPRPPLASEVAVYPDDVRRRLAVKPGLTGLWQISGRSDLPWEEAVRLDLRYVEHWSLTLDLVILIRTASAVLRSSGAY